MRKSTIKLIPKGSKIVKGSTKPKWIGKVVEWKDLDKKVEFDVEGKECLKDNRETKCEREDGLEEIRGKDSHSRSIGEEGKASLPGIYVGFIGKGIQQEVFWWKLYIGLGFVFVVRIWK